VFPPTQWNVGPEPARDGYYLALIQEFGRWRLGLRYDYYNPDQDSNKNAKGSPSRRMRAIPPWRWPRPVWRPGAD